MAAHSLSHASVPLPHDAKCNLNRTNLFFIIPPFSYAPTKYLERSLPGQSLYTSYPHAYRQFDSQKALIGRSLPLHAPPFEGVWPDPRIAATLSGASRLSSTLEGIFSLSLFLITMYHEDAVAWLLSADTQKARIYAWDARATNHIHYTRRNPSLFSLYSRWHPRVASQRVHTRIPAVRVLPIDTSSTALYAKAHYHV